MQKELILESLNDQQKLPVINYSGAQLIVAGPGAGKSHTVVSRVQYMLLDGVSPFNILVFTFTNKAAKEIKERIRTAVGDDADKITMGTYHSFCLKILRKYVDSTGYKSGFTVIDSDDSMSIIRKLDIGKLDSKVVASYIDLQKRKMISTQKALEDGDTLARYYKEYQDTLYLRNLMDFNDLIFNTIKLFETHPDILHDVNLRYKYISADEFHDSSESDIRLIQLLAGTEQNVCMILDDDQSIYGFRGANLEAVLNVRNMYPNMKTYFLTRNYRCSGNIVGASRSLIAKNKNSIEGKTVTTENAMGNKVIYFQENTPDLESARVCSLIKTLKAKYGYNYSDIAVLYRTSAQSRSIEEMMIKNHIPYEVLSGINFYSRKEIKDIVSFLSFTQNLYNVNAFNRIVNIPKRGIGEKTLEKIVENISPDETILDTIKRLIESKSIKGKAKTGLEDFLIKIESLISDLDNLTIDEMINRILEDFNYLDYLNKVDPNVFEEKKENIRELLNISYDYNTLEEFLETAALDRLEDETDTNKVHLLTMHMSKGLEWPVVFCIGISEGLLPHFNSLASQSQIEEERRLMYVAMTRAKQLLILSRSKKMRRNGYYIECRESRFISEIDSRYLYRH